jgi:hypothetical protein
MTAVPTTAVQSQPRKILKIPLPKQNDRMGTTELENGVASEQVARAHSPNNKPVQGRKGMLAEHAERLQTASTRLLRLLRLLVHPRKNSLPKPKPRLTNYKRPTESKLKRLLHKLRYLSCKHKQSTSLLLCLPKTLISSLAVSKPCPEVEMAECYVNRKHG